MSSYGMIDKQTIFTRRATAFGNAATARVNKWTDKHTYREVDRQTDRWVDKQTDRQAGGGWTDRQTDMFVKTYLRDRQN